MSSIGGFSSTPLPGSDFSRLGGDFGTLPQQTNRSGTAKARTAAPSNQGVLGVPDSLEKLGGKALVGRILVRMDRPQLAEASSNLPQRIDWNKLLSRLLTLVKSMEKDIDMTDKEMKDRENSFMLDRMGISRLPLDEKIKLEEFKEKYQNVWDAATSADEETSRVGVVQLHDLAELEGIDFKSMAHDVKADRDQNIYDSILAKIDKLSNECGGAGAFFNQAKIRKLTKMAEALAAVINADGKSGDKCACTKEEAVAKGFEQAGKAVAVQSNDPMIDNLREVHNLNDDQMVEAKELINFLISLIALKAGAAAMRAGGGGPPPTTMADSMRLNSEMVARESEITQGFSNLQEGIENSTLPPNLKTGFSNWVTGFQNSNLPEQMSTLVTSLVDQSGTSG